MKSIVIGEGISKAIENMATGFVIKLTPPSSSGSGVSSPRQSPLPSMSQNFSIKLQLRGEDLPAKVC